MVSSPLPDYRQPRSQEKPALRNNPLITRTHIHKSIPEPIGEGCITWAKPHKESHLNAEIFSRRRDSFFFKVRNLFKEPWRCTVRAGTMVNHFRCQREKYIKEEPWILYIIERKSKQKI